MRPDYPLISGDRWARLLAEEQFGEVVCLPAADPELPDPDQVVILARGPVDVEAGAGRPAPGSAWILCGDGGELADRLAARLRAGGAQVVTAEAGDRNPPEAGLIVFGDATPSPTWPAERCRVVTRGAAPFGRPAAGEPWATAVREQPKSHLVDLDPGQTPERQAAVLVEALRDADGRPAAYRNDQRYVCLLYTSPSPRDGLLSRMPSSA